jgi:hypothetical protein
MDKPPPHHPLLMPDQPNIRIHSDLFSPMLAAGRQHKYILCITDAFTKYALITAIKNREAETVARAIFQNGFVNLASQRKFTVTAGKCSIINYLRNFSIYLIWNILK